MRASVWCWALSTVLLALSELAAEGHLTLKRVDGTIASYVAEECASSQKVLVFWAVGKRQDARMLVRSNVKHMHAFLQKNCWDVFLHHYAKGGKMDWYLSDPSWYDREIQMSAEGPGFKFQLLRDHFLARSNSDWPTKYKYVWALDEDIDLSKAALGDFFGLAKLSQAAITGPALMQPSGSLEYPFQAPDENCDFRYTNFVEVIAPAIRMDALKALIMDCKGCIHNKTVWGLDNVWCGFVADALQLSNPSTACVIVDKAPVIHRDYRTLKGKYAVSTAGAQESDKFRDIGSADAIDVQKRYPSFFIPNADVKAWRCVNHKHTFSSSENGQARHGSHSLARLVSEVGF